VTPPRITRLGGYGSPLRGATGNGPPRGSRHQLFFASLPKKTATGKNMQVAVQQKLRVSRKLDN